MAMAGRLPGDGDQQCPSSFVVTRYPMTGTRYPFINREAR
jgi:hypothetical protein